MLWTCLHLPVRTFWDEQICGQMLRLWRRHLQGPADPILFTVAEENGHQTQTDSRKTLEVTLSTLSPESDCRCQRTQKPERWLWKELLPSGHLELNFHFSLTLSLLFVTSLTEPGMCPHQGPVCLPTAVVSSSFSPFWLLGSGVPGGSPSGPFWPHRCGAGPDWPVDEKLGSFKPACLVPQEDHG